MRNHLRDSRGSRPQFRATVPIDPPRTDRHSGAISVTVLSRQCREDFPYWLKARFARVQPASRDPALRALRALRAPHSRCRTKEEAHSPDGV